MRNIVIKTGEALYADRCFILEYDSKKQEYKYFKDYGVYIARPGARTLLEKNCPVKKWSLLHVL